jgi:hypothetical protein
LDFPRTETHTDGFELRVVFGDLGLVEERNEGLVRRLHNHELQRVVVECDALKGAQDGVKERSAGHCPGRR